MLNKNTNITVITTYYAQTDKKMLHASQKLANFDLKIVFGD